MSEIQPKPLDEADIALIKRYAGRSPYADVLERIEADIERIAENVRRLSGVVPSDTGLAPERAWDLAADAAALRDEQGLQVAKVMSLLPPHYNQNGDEDNNRGGKANAGGGGVGAGAHTAFDGEATRSMKTSADDFDSNRSDAYRYVVDVALGIEAKYVVGLADHLSPADVDEDARVGLDRVKYQIQLPLPARLETCVSMMQVEDAIVDTDYADVGGCDEQLRMIREVVELPLTHPERFARLGVEPPKGALLFGSPGMV